MKNAILLITCLFLLGNFNANAQWGSIKKAAKKVGSTTKKHVTKGAKKVGGTTKKYATSGGNKVWGATKSVGGTTKRYATTGGSKAWGATKSVGSTTKRYATTGGSKAWGVTKSVGSATKRYATKGGKLVFEGGKSLAGVVVSSGGTILVQGYGITKEVVVNGRIPKYRYITTREYNFANTYLYGGTLPAKSKILISNLLGAGNRPFVWPTGTGHILMNMGQSGYSNALYDEGLFIHEIAHVWQLHVTENIKWTIGGITTQIKNSTTDTDAYSVDCSDNWGRMNLEQQATVAENCFNQRKAGTLGGACEAKVVKYIRKGKRF